MTDAAGLAKLTDEVGDLVHSQMPADVAYVLLTVVNNTRLVNVSTNVEQRHQWIEVLREYVTAFDQGRMTEPVERPVRRKN